MPLAEAVPFQAVPPSSSGWLQTLRGALFQPRQQFGRLQPGPVGPAAKLTVISLGLVATAAVLTDDELYLGRVPLVLGRGLMMWVVGVLWLLGPQAFLFRQVMRLFGSSQPLSLAQHGMAAFAVLLSVFGVALSVAGISPESAPFVISWYLALATLTVLGTHALYQFAVGAYGLSPGKAVGAVLVFELVHGIALVITLSVLLTLIKV
ncbi:MAG: hypothetical protein ABW352_25925 [Polyangiales bacterium]